MSLTVILRNICGALISQSFLQLRDKASKLCSVCSPMNEHIKSRISGLRDVNGIDIAGLGIEHTIDELSRRSSLLCGFISTNIDD